MPAWTDYTSKTTPADTDEVMIKDFSDSNKANKRMLFSGLWNWIVNKLTNAVIANLETSPQTIVGAINSLNSNMKFTMDVSLKTYKIQHDAGNSSEALNLLNNPTLLIGIKESPYCILFADSTGETDLGGGISFVLGYTYPDDMYGYQMSMMFGSTNIKVRNKCFGDWSEWVSIVPSE